MIIPTNDRMKIMKYIFEEGCILVEDKKTGLHEDLEVENIYCLSLTNSLTSKNILKKVFVWNHGYYSITDEGIVELRSKLALPEDSLPITHRANVTRDEVDFDEKLEA